MTGDLGDMEIREGRVVLTFQRRLSHRLEKVWRGLTDPEHVEFARVGGEQSAYQTQKRRLASTIGPNKRGQRAASRIERHIVERLDGLALAAPKRLSQRACRQCNRIGVSHGGASCALA